MKQTDNQLVKQVLEGNIDSFGDLVRKYQGVVYGLAYHIVKNFADAEDLAQEVFVRAYFELPRLRDPSRFAGWLRRIAYNTCIMWIRREHTADVSLNATEENSEASFMLVPDRSDPSVVAERNELCDAVQKAIDSLSEKNRLAVTLFYMDGLSYKQISEFLEVPVTTIESRLHKARKQLKEEMTQMVEQDFSRRKLGPEFAIKVVEGILEIVPFPGHEPGYGFVRQGERGNNGAYKPSKDDIYVAPSQIRRFGLKAGDIIKGKARPPRKEGDIEEHYYAMVYIQTVNDEDPTEKFGDTRTVDGELEILETGYGFIRQGNTETESIYVTPSQIRNFDLKTGDVIKGKARPPRQDVGEHYYALFYIHKVNEREP
jgi:RNA polymerase sigma-70 factor (ECF subfamily)